MAFTINGTSGLTFPDATLQTSAAFDGAATTTSAVDITLSNTAGQTQVVSMTAAGKSVILPDATTFSTQGGPIYIIQNKGQNPFYIKNSAGTIIFGPLYYGQSLQIVLVSNATAAGTWSTAGIQTSSTPASVSPFSASSINMGTNQPYVVIAGLSSTQALVAYQNSANTNIQVVLATISGTTVTYGTPTTLAATNTQPVLNGVGLTSSLGVFLISSNTSIPQVVAVTVSGSTVTVGTPVNFGAVAMSTTTVPFSPYAANIFADTATTGVITYTTDNGVNMVINAQGFSVSGTTVTAGTAQILLNAAGTTGLSTPCATARLGTGSFVSIYAAGGLGTGHARTFTMSGTTITLGTQTSYASTTQQYTAIATAALSLGGYGASSTCGVFTGGNSWVIVNTSGTTISSVIAQQYLLVDNISTPYSPPSAFGTAGSISVDQYGRVAIFTGSSNGPGGVIQLGYVGMSNTRCVGYLDSTTNLLGGLYNNFVTTTVIKAN